MCEQVVSRHPIPAPGSIWRHWKGGLYRVVCVAVRESDGREMVVYEPADGSGHAWARDSIQWHMEITPKDGDKVPRFSLVQPAEVQAEPVEFEDTKPAGRPVEERGPEY